LWTLLVAGGYHCRALPPRTCARAPARTSGRRSPCQRHCALAARCAAQHACCLRSGGGLLGRGISALPAVLLTAALRLQRRCH